MTSEPNAKTKKDFSSFDPYGPELDEAIHNAQPMSDNARDVPPGIDPDLGEQSDGSAKGDNCGSTPDGFSEPLPLCRDLPPAADYPLDALPPVLKNLALKMTEIIQTPVAIAGNSLLAASSLAVQGHADIEIDGRIIPPSLFMITVAVSGERKSAVDDICLLPHRRREKELRAEYNKQMETYRNEFECWKRTRESVLKKKSITDKRIALEDLGPEPTEPINPMLIMQEPSYEGLIKQFDRGWPSIGLFTDEGGRLLNGYAWSQDNQVKTATGLSELWQGKQITRVRGEGSTVLYGRRLAIHLMIQPTLIPQLLSEQLIGQGFAARLLVSYPESTIGSRRYKEENVFSTAEMNRYCNVMDALLSKRLPLAEETTNELNPRRLKISCDAKRIWINFHNDIEQLQQPGDELSAVKGEASKIAEQALRLAGVLAIVDNCDSQEIASAHMESGIELARYYLGEVMRIRSGGAVDPDLLLAEQALKWGLTRGNHQFAAETLYRLGPNQIRDQKTAKHVMNILIDHGWARALPAGTVVDGKSRKIAWEVRS